MTTPEIAAVLAQRLHFNTFGGCCCLPLLGCELQPCWFRAFGDRAAAAPCTKLFLPAQSAGGNPVSMAAGRAVLRVIDQQQLQGNCAQVGGYLLDRLRCGSSVVVSSQRAILFA